MINNNLAKLDLINSHYRLDAIQTFKREVKNELDHGLIPIAQKVLQKILPFYELTPKDLSQDTLSELNTWLLSLGAWDELKEYLQDDQVRELIIHNSREIELKCLGPTKLLTLNQEISDFELKVQYLVNKKRVIFDFNHPFVSFNERLYEQAFRVSVAHESITTNHKCKIFFRKLTQTDLNLDSFIDKSQIEIVRKLMLEKKNIIVAGSTGSGKTSFLIQLLKEIPALEHILILEDTEEIPQLRANFTRLLADPLSDLKSLETYMRYALRMSPDRIVIGELRSSEIIPFVLAMNTGHKGLLSSIHASSARDTVYRLALLFSLYGQKQNLSYQNILNLHCNNLEYVIFLKDKKVHELIKIIGVENDQLIFDQIFSRV